LKFERQDTARFASTTTTPTDSPSTRELDISRSPSAVESESSVLSTVDRKEAKKRREKEREERERNEKAELAARRRKELKERVRKEQEAREQAEREFRERAEREDEERAKKELRVARRRAEKEAAKKAEQEAREKAEREEREKAEETARLKAEKLAKRRAEKEAREQAERETREKAEQDAREKVERESKEKEERERERLERERIEVSVSSENKRFADAEQGPSPTEPTPPILASETALEALQGATPVLKAPKDIKVEVPTTPKSRPTPSFTPGHQAQIPAPAPVPANIESEKPLSLWERKKLETSPPASPSSLFAGSDAINSVWGEAGGGGSTQPITMPTLAGDRQSVFTHAARDQKRENQRESVVEGLLGSNPARRNDSAQSQMTVKYPTAPAPAPQKSSGWGSCGKPRIEEPPRGFTPSQPPKSQPAGFGSVNKPAWGAGGMGNSSLWGPPKTGPTPIIQDPSAKPAWGNKPTGSTFGSGRTGLGSGTGPAFGSGKNITVDTSKRPSESSPNTPELAVEIKLSPAPGAFYSSITDKEAGDVQEDA